MGGWVIISMEKTFKLAFLFCFALILFCPKTIYASDVDLSVTVNAVNGDGAFSFTAAPIGSPFSSPSNFSITTQGSSGQGAANLKNVNYQFNLTQTLPNGWRQTGAICVTPGSAQFSYTNDGAGSGNVYVNLKSSDSYQINCTITDTYSSDWLVIPSTTVKVIVNTIDGDNTFNFVEKDATGFTTPQINFGVTTQNNTGNNQIVLAVQSRWFYLTQTDLPAGWRQISENCTGAKTGSNFTYSNNGTGNIYVSLDSGNNNIVCTVTDQYSEDWLENNLYGYLTINTESIGGDQTFRYRVFDNLYLANDQPADFDGSTVNGQGSINYVWNGTCPSFTVTQTTPSGWQPAVVVCSAKPAGTSISLVQDYLTSGATFNINPGYNRITCTFTNQLMAPAKTPVLFVPGMLSTEINDGQEKIWPDPLKMLEGNSFMDVMGFDSNMNALYNSVYSKDVIGRELNFYDYSESIIKEFTNQGYEKSKNLFLFPYDWRYGVSGVYPDGKTNSQLLAEKIAQIRRQTGADKVDVIAHSLGGLIVKKYVMDSTDPKIDKLVFVGVPNLGSPLADKALLMGHGFNILGLLSEEIKKLSLNMPLAYDLLPSQDYYNVKGSYIETVSANYLQPETKNLNQEETIAYLENKGLNSAAINNATNLHTDDFDSYDVRQKSIDVYNITGCKSGTIQGVKDQQRADGTSALYPLGEFNESGDNTVPFESADSIKADDNKKFYAIKANHGSMPSQDGIRQKIVNILTGSQLPVGNNIITYADLENDKSKCELWGREIIIKSPLDIVVVDANNNRLGFAENGSMQNDIPGASFDVFDGHKYVYLPTGDGENYSINLKGTGVGTFTLIDAKIEASKTTTAQVFNDVPVTTGFSANLNIENDVPVINENNGISLQPTGVVGGNASLDILPPVTTATLTGDQGNAGFYHSDVTVKLSAQDVAQEDSVSAGVLSINYSIDGGANLPVFASGKSFTISTEGSHTVRFFSKDKLGNVEGEKSINFAIDKAAPEIQFSFDQSKKDLVFVASDTLSGPGSIADQNGVITANDNAGNNTQLKFVEKNRSQSLRAQVSGLSYNGKTVDIGNNQLAFAWFYGFTPAISAALTGTLPLPTIPATMPKSNTLTFLLQQAKLKDGSFIVAVYVNNKTMILEYKNKKLSLKTIASLKIVNFATNTGTFFWSY